MSSPVVTVDPKTSLRAAEQQMHDHDVSCVAVVSNDQLVGVVTKLDFLEPISQMGAEEKRKFTIQFGTKGVDVTPDQQAFMMDEYDSFSHRYQEAFQLGTLIRVHEKPWKQRRPRRTPHPLPLAIPHSPRHILRSIRRLGRRTYIPRRTRPPRPQTPTQQRTLSLQPQIRQRLPTQNRLTLRRRINFSSFLFVCSFFLFSLFMWVKPF